MGSLCGKGDKNSNTNRGGASGKGLYNASYDQNSKKFTFVNKDGSKTKEFTTCRISCRSGSMSKKSNYAGMIVYDIGTFDAKKNTGNNVFPGWILIKNSADLNNIKATEGQVHGKLCV